MKACQVLSCLVAASSAACGASDAATGGVTMTRDAAVGARFHTPGPRSCHAPAQTGDALSAADARAYVICGIEGAYAADRSQLDLVSDVVVQVAPARPYNQLTDSFEGVDPRRPVHDVRGSMTRYTCLVPGDRALGLPRYDGQTCKGGPNPHASGVCFHDSFGDWHCTFLDRSYDIVTARGIAPPARD